MTRNTRILAALLAVLLVISLNSCSLWNRFFGPKAEETQLGTYVTLPEQILSDGDEVTWSFAELPETSTLQGFMPSDTSALISFKPDVQGLYTIQLSRLVDGESEEETFSFEVIMPEDGEPLNEAPPTHVAAYLAAQADTAKPDEELASTIPGTGEKREYLTKLVTPGKSKASKPKTTRSTRGTSRKKAAVKPRPNRADLIPQATKTYTIQVSAWPKLSDAQLASDQLLEQYGIDNYIQRAFFKDKDEVYYRIRVGNFPSYAEADVYAKEIRNQTNLPAWVDFVRQEM